MGARVPSRPPAAAAARVHRFNYDTPPLGSTDIAHLVSCCPALEDLVFTPAADASLAPLQSLTALTRLNLGPVSPAVISSDLTALTQLRSLDVSVSLPAAAAGEDASSGLQHLVPLTSLTRLTWFDSPGLRLRSSKVSHPRALHACTAGLVLAYVTWQPEYRTALFEWHRAACCPVQWQHSTPFILLPGGRTIVD